jgi:hypothetical protein
MSLVTLTFNFNSESDALAFMQRNTPVAADNVDQVQAPAPKPAAAAAAAPKPPKAEKPAAPKAAEPAAVDYPTLQKAVFALAAKNKPRVLELLQELRVGSFKELPPEAYADALKRVEAAAAEPVEEAVA